MRMAHFNAQSLKPLLAYFQKNGGKNYLDFCLFLLDLNMVGPLLSWAFQFCKENIDEFEAKVLSRDRELIEHVNQQADFYSSFSENEPVGRIIISSNSTTKNSSENEIVDKNPEDSEGFQKTQQPTPNRRRIAGTKPTKQQRNNNNNSTQNLSTSTIATTTTTSTSTTTTTTTTNSTVIHPNSTNNNNDIVINTPRDESKEDTALIVPSITNAVLSTLSGQETLRGSIPRDILSPPSSFVAPPPPVGDYLNSPYGAQLQYLIILFMFLSTVILAAFLSSQFGDKFYFF